MEKGKGQQNPLVTAVAVPIVIFTIVGMPIAENFLEKESTSHIHQDNVVHPNFGNVTVSGISASVSGIIK